MNKNTNFFKIPEKVFGISSGLIKLFFVPLLVIMVFFVSIGLVILPKITSIKSLKVSINKIKNQIKLTEEKSNYLLSIDQEQLNRDASNLSSAVLQEKNSYLLVGVIRNIADKYNFLVNSFSISPIEIKQNSDQSLKIADKSVASKVPIHITLTGPKDNSLNLIKALENNLPILFIDSYSNSVKSNISELELVISSYYIADKTDLVTGNLTLNDLKPTLEEAELLEQISRFEKNQTLMKISNEEGQSFVEYNRDNPFSL